VDPRIAAPLQLCGPSEALVFVCPFPLTAGDHAALVADARVVRLLDDAGTVLFDRDRRPTSPLRPGSLVYPGFRRRLSTSTLLAARRAGCRWVVWRTGCGWRGARIDLALLGRAIAVGRGRLSAMADRLRLSSPAGGRSFRGLARDQPRSCPVLAEGRRPRLVLVTGSLEAGGAERQAVQAARALAATGRMEVTLSADTLPASGSGAFYLPTLAGSGVRVVRVGAEATGSSRETCARARELLRSAPADLSDGVAELIEDFEGQRPDVVHAWQDAVNLRAGIAAVLAGVPRIVLSTRSVRHTRFTYHRHYMREAYLALAARPEVVLLGNSRAGTRDYAQWLRIPESRFQVVPNGIDPSLFPPLTGADRARAKEALGIPSNAPVLGGVFGLRAEKRPMLWLAAARRVRAAHSDAHLLVLGGGAMRRRFESAAARAGLSGTLHTVSVPEDPAPLISLMDVCLLTSRHEGLPNVLLEAQLLGVPVVATAAGGAAEAVREGESGWIVEGSDPRALASRVVWLLDDSAVRARAAVAGPDFVRTRFTIEQMTTRLLAAYGME
jgi:glycosyltransferase involved in cell wall biosynthesis